MQGPCLRLHHACPQLGGVSQGPPTSGSRPRARVQRSGISEGDPRARWMTRAARDETELWKKEVDSEEGWGETRVRREKGGASIPQRRAGGWRKWH